MNYFTSIPLFFILAPPALASETVNLHTKLYGSKTSMLDGQKQVKSCWLVPPVLSSNVSKVVS